MNSATKANIYLLLTTAIWGATFPLIHDAIAHLNPFLFVGLRFLVAGLLLIPLLRSSLKITNSQFFIGCILLGIINGAAYTTQTLGIQTITSSRAAFITGLNVIIIPLLAPLFKLGRINYMDLLCSLICLMGLYILTGADLKDISHGDLWVLLSAFLFAISVNYLQRLSHRFTNYSAIAFYLIMFSAVLPLSIGIDANFSAVFQPTALFGLLFCAIAATSLAIYWQAKYQQQTTAPKAALIYSLEPVFASILGFMINGEKIGYETFIGGGFILLSLMLPAFVALIKKVPKTSAEPSLT